MYFKLKNILTKNQIILVYSFIFLSLITMIIELAGIGLIIPFIQSLTLDSSNNAIIKYLNMFGLFPQNDSELILILITIILIIYTFKTIYLTFFSYVQTKFLAGLRVSLSDKIYNIYLNKPFEFHLNNNSSKLIRNIDEVRLVVGLIQFIVIICTETIIFFGISFFVIWHEPVNALIVILFFSFFGYIFFKAVKQRVKKWGELRQKYSGFKLKILNEGFRLIKFVKILQKANEFIGIFSNNNKALNQCEIKQNFIDSLPKLWLEWLIVIAFTLVIFVTIYMGRDIHYILPTIGLFVVAAFRIMPSLTRIMNCTQKIIYNKPALETIYFEFVKKNKKDILGEKKDINLSFKNNLDLININFKYQQSENLLLKNINLQIKKGHTIGIVGESGKGKTTFINIILGLMKPTEGKINVDGINIFTNVESWQNKIGYVSQDIFLTDDTIKKNIAFGVPDNQIDEKQIDFALKNSKLQEFISTLKDGLETKIGEFGDRISGGQRQRIAIARALYNNPEVLILDEFTNSLDNYTEEKIISELSSFKRKKTIIMIAHRLSSLKNCDQVYRLESGSLAQEKLA